MSDIIFKIASSVLRVILNCGIIYVILCFGFLDFLNPSIGSWRIILVMAIWMEYELKKSKESKRTTRTTKPIS